MPFSTNPCRSLQQVRETVRCRTGQEISWKRQIECRELDEQELTLPQALVTALLNNPRLQAAYEQVGIAQADLAQASLLKNPLTELAIRYDHLSHYMVEAGLMQNILEICLMPLKKKMALAERAAAKAEVAGLVINLIAGVKTAFVSLQTKELLLKKKKLLQEAALAAFEFAKRLDQAGNITGLERERYQLLYETSALELFEAEIAAYEAKEALQVLLGLNGTCSTWNVSSELPPLLIEVPECLEEKVIFANFELQAKRYRLLALAAHSGIKVADTVFIEGGAGVHAEREPSGEWYTGPQVVFGLPLFDWGGAQKAKGKAEMWQLMQLYAAETIELRSKARLAAYRLKHACEVYQHLADKLLPLAEDITRNTLKYYNGMQKGVFDVLSAKREEIEVEERKFKVLLDCLKASTELEKLVNGGS